MNGISEIRPSPIAGTWYSGSPDTLSRQIDQYLSDARIPTIQGEVVALIAPHAGHRYSGKTAGHAFACIAGQKRDLAVVISPMHGLHSADLLTTAHQAYGTPLGPVRVDQNALSQLITILEQQNLSLIPVANDREHSLEIELPFLQRALQDEFQLLPVMLRSQSPAVARKLGLSLAKMLATRNSLLVASTDLAHFYPEPINRELDAEMLRRIQSFDPESLFEAERAGKGFACGVAAVACVLWASRELGANHVEILHYSNSGNESGDYSSVVGYGAAAVIKQA